MLCERRLALTKTIRRRAMGEKHGDEVVVDIEQYAKDGREVPAAEKYRIRIDKDFFVVETAEITGAELLALAKKTPPERFSLYQKLKGGETKKIELIQTVDLRSPGLERFMTLPLDQTEGSAVGAIKEEWVPRRHFSLLPEDTEFLEQSGLSWEAVIENNVHRVVLYGVTVPESYRQSSVDLYLRIEKNYPDTQIDMVYFHPAVELSSGRSIGSISSENFDGKAWQRWSRHRTPQNPWRPGVDNIESHLMLVNEWLAKEARGH